MTKRFSLRKVAITLLSALFVLCASFGIVSAKNANSVKADEVVAFQMLDGADLRLDAENNGLRFAATVPSDYVEGDVYRMLIVPASWIKDVEIPNGDYIAYLEETYPKQELAIAPLHPITWAEESVAGFEEGKRYFLGAITDIKYENLNREFFAIAYRTNGEVREYATFNEGQNVRSVFYIASAYAGVFEADTDSAKIVDNFIVSAINQKAGVAEADKLNAVSYDLSIAGSDTVKIGETASYAVAGTVGGVNISSLNAIVSYSVEGNGASISADGVLSVSEEGTVTVKAFVLGQELTKVVTIDVVKESIVENGVVAYASKTDDLGNVVSNNFTYAVEGEVISVKIGDAAVAYTFENGVVTIASDTLKANVGSGKVITIETSAKDYVLNTTIATFAITKFTDISNCTKGDALAPYKIAGGAVQGAKLNQIGHRFTGYFVLLNDIDGNGQILNGGNPTNGATGAACTYGLQGTIDGLGHTISNFTIGGGSSAWCYAFDYAEAGSTLQNISLVDFTTVGYSEGLFCAAPRAWVTNVYIECTPGSNYGIFGNGSLYTSAYTNVTIVLKTGSATAAKISHGVYNDFRGFKNCKLITDYPVDQSLIDAGLKVLSLTDNSIESVVIEGQDGLVNFLGATQVYLNGKAIINEITTTKEGFIVPAKYVAYGTKLTAVSASDAKIITLVKDADVVKDFVAYAKKADNAGSILSNDFTYAVEGNVTAVTIAGNAVDYTVDNGVVTIASSVLLANVGVKEISISTDIKDYRFVDATIATFGADKFTDISNCGNGTGTLAPAMKALGATSASFKEAAAKATGYIVLLNDIDAEGKVFNFGYYGLNSLGGNGANPYYGFAGTFDGNGYTISNFKTSVNNNGSIFGQSTTARTIKDLNLVGQISDGSYFEGIFGFMAGCVSLTNVYIDMVMNTSAGYGLFGAALGGMNANNCTFVVRTGTKALTSNALANRITNANDAGYWHKANTFTNTAVITDYVVVDDIKNCGLKVYGYQENKVVLAIDAGVDNVIEIAGVSKVYANGKDVTSKLTITATNVTLSADLAVYGNELVVVGSDFAKLVTLAKDNIVVNNYVAWASETNEAGEIVDNSLDYTVSSAIVSVKINGSAVEYSYANGVVSIPASVLKANTGANKQIIISTEEKDYILNSTIGTFGITKISDIAPGTNVLAAWRKAGGATSVNFKEAGNASSGYIVLTTNLVGNGEMFHDGTYGTSAIGPAGNAACYGFTGTFDGCGYSISNVVMGRTNAWVSGFGCTRSSAVIKNLTLNFATTGAHFQGIFNEYATGTIENCTFDITSNSTSGRVFGAYIAGLNVINSTLIVRTGSYTELTDALAFLGVHTDGNQGSSVSKGASFVNTTLYTDYPVNEAYAGYGLVTKSIKEIPA